MLACHFSGLELHHKGRELLYNFEHYDGEGFDLVDKDTHWNICEDITTLFEVGRLF